MNRSEFWRVIQRSFDNCAGDVDKQVETLKAALKPLSPEELVSFDGHFQAHSRVAYTWGLWGAAYIIGGGCSDDEFIDFRSWLISRGREWYERALKNPDDLANYPEHFAKDGARFEEFAHVALRIYKSKVGRMPDRLSLPIPASKTINEPRGESWDENDADMFQTRWPKLLEKYWQG